MSSWRVPIDPVHPYVTLDWDVRYDTRHSTLKWRSMVAFLTGAGIHEVMTRHSAGGNTHVIIKWTYDLTFWERLVIRSILQDDPYRISADIRRYYRGLPVERLFGIKATPGVLRKAGPWTRETF